MSQTKKVVKISESELVDLIDNILTEALAVKKQEWISEQANAGNKTPMLEQKLSQLEARINSFGKK